jgi:hypothetical protein
MFAALSAPRMLAAGAPADWPERATIEWTTPSVDHNGSMPLGNGDIGLNVWVEPDGDMLLYVSTTDAWSDNFRLLKLGRVRIAVTPNPFASGKPFVQRLKLSTGTIEIVAGDAGSSVSIDVGL